MEQNNTYYKEVNIMPGESNEIPESISSEVASELTTELTTRERWNERFNTIANKLSTNIENAKGALGSTDPEMTLPPKFAAMVMENVAANELNVLLSLTEMAAKATGGRKSTEESSS